MINILILLLLGGFLPNDCDSSFDKFVNANKLTEAPSGDSAYLLKLNIRTELANTTHSVKQIDQQLTAMIYDNGFCMKTDDVIIIGDHGELLFVMPKTRTIIKSKYDASQLPDIIQLSNYQKDRLKSASNKSCSLVNFGDKSRYELTADFDQPLIIQSEMVNSIKYIVDETTFKLEKVELYYETNQKINRQIIQYVQQDLSASKSKALKMSNVFNEDGSLRNEFLHYEIIQQ